MGPAAAPHAASLVEYVVNQGEFDDEQCLYSLGSEAILRSILPQMGKSESYRQMYFNLTFLSHDFCRGEQSARLLAEHLGDSSVEVRQMVAGTLREMGEEARPVLDDVKKSARDEDPEVAWFAAMTLLALLPLDDVLAAVPDPGTADPLKGEADQIVSRLLVPGQLSEETRKMMATLRHDAPRGYWVHSLRNPNPRIRFLATCICELGDRPRESVLKSVLEDEQTTPDLKSRVEQMLEQTEQSRILNGR